MGGLLRARCHDAIAMTDRQLLERLAELAGLQTSYRDAWGTQREVPETTCRALLALMGYSVDDDDAVLRSTEAFEHRIHGELLPPVVVAHQEDGFATVPVTMPVGQRGRLNWRLTLEDGAVIEDSADLAMLPPDHAPQNGVEFRRLTITHPLPLGYHALTVKVTAQRHATNGRTRLIIAPRQCYRPGAFEGEGRRWGLAVQLYAVRSKRNWGFGDFTDLMGIVRGAARLGAAAVGLNPLHALFPLQPESASPYAPSSRIFLNVFYLDIEAMDDYRDSAAARRAVADPRFQARLRALREAKLVDYRAVASCKLEILELLYRSFRERSRHEPDSPRAREFHEFCDAGGRALQNFAVFETLAERAIAEGRGFGFHSWDAELRDPESAAVRRLAEALSERVEYHQYLQWQAERQLAEIRRIAERLGMSIGLYHDLAVGVDGGGAEAWDWQRVLASGASIGAPPDEWNRNGQDWGLPPLDPRRLVEHAYAPFVELLRATMRRGGALRIDHILGLMRLYWIPSGAPPDDGAYIRYPWRELLAIVALESRRNRCLVVGEDLGTVPEGLREAMADAGILSYRLLYFEKESETQSRPPDRYPREALVAIGTHDLPTLAAYWTGSDLALRDRLNLWPSPAQRDAASHARGTDRAALIDLLRREQLLVAEAPCDEAPIDALYGMLAKTPSRLLMVQIEDMVRQIEQMNVPGTDRQYPNWRWRLATDARAIYTGEPMLALARTLNRWRSDRPGFAPLPGPDGEHKLPAAIPGATYRLQLTRDFTFDDVSRVVPYLAALGITHLYLSPYFAARPGTQHGYDITDHNALNPELGGRDGFEHMVAVLADGGLGHIVDFVPNHMGIGRTDNVWWLDVLEWGRASPYASYFDIDWEPTDRHLHNKVLLPFLGGHYGAELEAGKLVPRFDAPSGTYSVWYFEHRFPIAVSHYADLLRLAVDTATTGQGPETSLGDALALLAVQFEKLFAGGHLMHAAARHAEARNLQTQLADLACVQPAVAEALADGVAALAGNPEDPESFRPLHRLLERQHYRLAYWHVASDEINYRRFFSINDLAGIRVENPELFAAIHRLVASLIATGKLQGLRIDHIDGLFDPGEYCARLQALIAKQGETRSRYVVVEKILARHERLRADWPVAGTTGYDFIGQLNGLLVDSRQEAAATRNYERFIRREADFDELLRDAKHLVMDTMLGSELGVLATDLHRIAQRHWNSRDYTWDGLRWALRAVIACFPVYRTYVTSQGVSAEDRRDIEWAVARARKEWRGLGQEILDFVGAVLTTDVGQTPISEPARDEVIRFAMKFQQYTGPVMAKGLEDTTFYRYHRLISLNEVGGDPRQFGLSVAAFHHANQERARDWPYAMLATATHDTKRGEDVRARVAVLSEIPAEWAQATSRWAKLNQRHKQEFDGRPAPGRNDEYLLYQTLVGALPPDFTAEGEAGSFSKRLQAYMTKAAREAKERTSWDNPNTDYEAALGPFIVRILDPVRGRPFLRHFLPFHARIARLGMLNSLVQTTLKLTAPGVSDLYQGTELWDLSLVDPDNRRPVAFADRAALLDEIAALGAEPRDRLPAIVDRLREAWSDGRIKLYLIHRLLALRREIPQLLTGAEYRPLAVEGAQTERVCAFLRSAGGRMAIVVAGRHFAALTAFTATLPAPESWEDTALILPAGTPPLDDSLTGRHFTAGRVAIPLRELFSNLPVAVLTGPGES
jgi:(1->4)-alpha-D-glucan 1-alpha-D-glucosylmutase